MLRVLVSFHSTFPTNSPFHATTLEVFFSAEFMISLRIGKISLKGIKMIKETYGLFVANRFSRLSTDALYRKLKEQIFLYFIA